MRNTDTSETNFTPLPPIFDLSVASMTGRIPYANLPVGTNSASVAAGDDPRFPKPPAANSSRAREVWITPDPVNGGGTGTCDDPFDGSAGNFDLKLNGLTEPTVIHLLAGTFHTKGSEPNGIKVTDGWIIKGAGMDLTTIILDPVSPNSVYGLHFGDAAAVPDRFEIHDLTLDGNVQAQPQGNTLEGNLHVNGATIQGAFTANHGGIYNVRLKNWGGTPNTTGVEGFGLTVGMRDNADHEAHVEIRGCVVEPAPYGGGSYLGLGTAVQGAGDPPEFLATGIIEGNTVNCDPASAAIALAGRFRGVRVVNNHIRHAGRGFHQDTVAFPANLTLDSRDVLVANNYFEECEQMVGLGSHDITGAGLTPLNRYMIVNNVCTISKIYAIQANFDSIIHLDPLVRDAVIANNRVSLSSAAAGESHLNQFLYLVGENGAVSVTDNIVDPAVGDQGVFNPVGTTVVNCWGNRRTDGRSIVGLEDRGVGPTFSGVTSTDALLIGGQAAVHEAFTFNGNYDNGTAPGRYRLRFSANLYAGLPLTSPLYLCRINHLDGKEVVFLFEFRRREQGGPGSIKTTVLSGDSLLVIPTAATLGNNPTAPQVDFAIAQDQAQFAGYCQFSVTQLGNYGLRTDQGVQASYSWSAVAESASEPSHAQVVNGTTTGTLSAVPTLTDGKLAVPTVALHNLTTDAVVKNGDYTLLPSDPDIEADTSSQVFTLTLHSASGNAGLVRTISNVAAPRAGNTLVLATNDPDVFSDGSSSRNVAPGRSVRLKVNSTGDKFLVV